jgi:hypothetical protein
VSSLSDWLDRRRPRPPVELERALLDADDGAGDGGRDPTEALAERARGRLGRALGRPGRVRESAFELLAADALLTYACEAALEAPDPDAALTGLLVFGSGP